MKYNGIKINYKKVKIFIPYEFTDLNTYIEIERSNKFAGAKCKKLNTEWAIIGVKKYKEQVKSLKLPLKIIYRWHLSNKRKDLDNVAFSKKFINDGLVSSGCLKNDGQKQIIAFEDIIVYSDKLGVEIELLEV